MKIFALDTSAAAASCALLDGERPVGEFYTDARLTHSQTIMPMVEALLSSGHQELDSVDVFAVSSGPGSFTGLRIGVAAVKGMAQVLGRPCVAVSTPVMASGVTTNSCATGPALPAPCWTPAAVRYIPRSLTWRTASAAFGRTKPSWPRSFAPGWRR